MGGIGQNLKRLLRRLQTRDSYGEVRMKVARQAASLLIALPLTLPGQAGLEYALKSGGAISPAPGGHSVIAGCQVGSALLPCLSHSYPGATIRTGAILAVIAVYWVAGSSGYRA